MTSLDQAEEALHLGKWLQGRNKASEVLADANSSGPELTRAFYVLLQVDFQTGRLTDLEETAKYYGRDLNCLPVTVILLWGVIALEMEAGAAARSVLSKYVTSSSRNGPALSPEDALALSRLYAVRVLADFVGDWTGAQDWLEAGGAGLSQEQQQLLLSELANLKGAGDLNSSTTCGLATEQRAAAQHGSMEQAGGTLRSSSQQAATSSQAASWAEQLQQPGAFCTMMGEIEELDDAHFPTEGSAAAAAASAAAATASPAGLASAYHDSSSGDGHERRTDQAQEQGSGAKALAWAKERASTCWEAPVVQETLRALHLQDVPVWQLAGGAAAFALLTYSLYRERRSVRRAAGGLAGGVASGLVQIASMATGFQPDAMVVAPRGNV